MANNAVLKTELTTDPLGRGYSGMTDQQAADSLNAANRTYQVTTLTGSQMYELINNAEFESLSTANKQIIRDVIALDTIQVQSGRARANITAIFTAQTVTRANLVAAVNVTCSRAREIGAVMNGEQVTATHVKQARAL